MAIKFSTVQAGDILYDVHRYRMGNTTMSATGVWTVRVIEVQENGASVSWNGNAPRFWPSYKIERLRRSMPKPKVKA